MLVPVIAALGYEFIYFGANHADNPIIKILLTPGLWVQALTTREPDDEQLKVGIMAMKAAIEADQEVPTRCHPKSSTPVGRAICRLKELVTCAERRCAFACQISGGKRRLQIIAAGFGIDIYHFSAEKKPFYQT